MSANSKCLHSTIVAWNRTSAKKLSCMPPPDWSPTFGLFSGLKRANTAWLLA